MAVERFSRRTIGEVHLRLLPYLDIRQLGLIHLAEDPNLTQIHNSEQIHLRVDERTVMVRLAFGHDSIYRGIDLDSSLDHSFSFESLDLLVGDIPQSQPAARGIEQIIRSVGDPSKGAILENLPGLQRKQVLPLCGNQVRTVNSE